MPSKKKRKVELAKDDGSGRPLKWQFVDDSAAAKAQRKQQRYIQQADETEAAAKLAAQQERATAAKVGVAQSDQDREEVEFDITLDSARRTRSSMKKPRVNPSPVQAAQQERATAAKVGLAQTSPDQGGVEFDITLDSSRRTRASRKKSPLNPSPLLASGSKSSPESDPGPARTQFEVTLSAAGDAGQRYVVEDSHVRDFSEGAAAQPPVTATARKRRNGESGTEWDPYLVQLLTDAFSSAKDVILVLETTIMADRWWPQWQQAIGRQMMPPGGGKPWVIVGMCLDEVQRLLRLTSGENPTGRGAPRPGNTITALSEAFSMWMRKRTSRLMVLVQMKDNGPLHFDSETKCSGSLMKAFKVGRETQAQGIKCLLVLMRNSFEDGKALQRAAAAVVEGESRKTTVYVATPDDEVKRQSFPKIHSPFEIALRKWTAGVCGDITPDCCARPYGAKEEEDVLEGAPHSAALVAAGRSSSSSTSSSMRAGMHHSGDEELWQSWPGVTEDVQRGAASSLRPPVADDRSGAQARSTWKEQPRAPTSSQTLGEMREVGGDEQPLHFTKPMQDRIRELQISDSDTAFEVAKDVSSMVGGVHQYGKNVQNDIVQAAFYKLRATKRHGQVMKHLAEGDRDLLNSGWDYFLGVLQRLEPEVDARKAAKRRYEELAQGTDTIAAFNVQFQAALSGLEATGLARQCTFDSVVTDYLEKLADASVRLAVYQAYAAAKRGWASDGPLDRTGREALKRLLTEAAEMVSKAAPGASSIAASAAAMGTPWSPPRERYDS